MEYATVLMWFPQYVKGSTTISGTDVWTYNKILLIVVIVIVITNTAFIILIATVGFSARISVCVLAFIMVLLQAANGTNTNKSPVTSSLVAT